MSPTPSIAQAIAKAIHDDHLRSQLIAEPKKTLQQLNVSIPENQAVTVLESHEHQAFFVLPMMTENEVKQLEASLSSVRSQRATRSRILIKAMQDPGYKAQLFADPETVLRAEGLPIPPSTKLTILENSEQQLYIVLPHLHTQR